MIARELEENGPKVYIIDQRLATLEMAATQAVSVILTTRTKHLLATTKKDGHIIPLRGDVAKKGDLARVELITTKDGFINILIANTESLVQTP